MARDRASRPGAKPLRLFVAVDVPLEIRTAVAAAIEPLRERHPRARWAPPENWHVTLKFLGATYPRLVEWVSASVASAAAEGSGLETSLSGLGAFPSAGRARVLWAGLDDSRGRLAALAQALDHVLAREFKPENRAFKPHLTIARSDPPLRVDGLEAIEVTSERFRIDRLVLYRSHLRRPAPRYEPLAEFELSG